MSITEGLRLISTENFLRSKEPRKYSPYFAVVTKYTLLVNTAFSEHPQTMTHSLR